MTLLFVLHLAATLAMTGVICSVQLVKYPLFGEVEPSHFPRYHEAHVRRIGWVVMPAMLLEATTGIALMLYVPTSPALLVALSLLGAVSLSTAAIQVPVHRELSKSWSAASVQSFVRGNWIRTSAWTASTGSSTGSTPFFCRSGPLGGGCETSASQ